MQKRWFLLGAVALAGAGTMALHACHHAHTDYVKFDAFSRHFKGCVKARDTRHIVNLSRINLATKDKDGNWHHLGREPDAANARLYASSTGVLVTLEAARTHDGLASVAVYSPDPAILQASSMLSDPNDRQALALSRLDRACYAQAKAELFGRPLQRSAVRLAGLGR